MLNLAVRKIDRGSDVVPSAFVLLVVAYMLTALVQDLLPFSVNRLIGALIIIILGLDCLKHLTNLRVLALCAIGFLFVIHVGITTTSLNDELEFYIYWVAALLTLSYLAYGQNIDKLVEVVSRQSKICRLACYLSTILIAVLLLTHTGYVVSWGGDLYFKGFCNTEHTMASVCCLVMAISFLCVRKESMAVFFFPVIGIVMTWALLQTGARTFIVPALIIWLLFVFYCVKAKWVRLLITLVLAIAVISVYSVTGMSSKFDVVSNTSTGNSFLNAITSGRIGYWNVDITSYLNGDPLIWLFGDSAAAVYDLNMSIFRMRIWSHNDFVMLLCSVGLLGLLIYAVTLKQFFWKIQGRISTPVFTSILIFVLLPAFINGFYCYQHLLYSSAFLVCAVCCSDKAETVI